MSSANFVETINLEAVRRLLDVRLLTIFTGVNPAAGAEALVTVPGGEHWEVLSLLVSFVTDATVANRMPSLIVDDGTTRTQRIGSSAQQAASITGAWGWYADIGVVINSSQGNVFATPMQRMFLAPGWRIGTLTVNLAPGDDYTAPVLCVRRYSPGQLRQVAAEIENELLSQQIGG